MTASVDPTYLKIAGILTPDYARAIVRALKKSKANMKTNSMPANFVFFTSASINNQ